MKKERFPLIAANIALLLMMEPYYIDKVHSVEPIEVVPNHLIEAEDKLAEESGPIKKLPWDSNEEFLRAKDANNTPVLIAGFCAVLNNPLPGEEYNVRLAAKDIKGILVEKDEVFSQNASIGPYTRERGYRDGASFQNGAIVETEGGGVCKIATSLYNLTILSDLQVVERHNHSMPVNYVPYGQDATVAYGYKDFKFRNTGGDSILIWSEMIDNRLYMAFYGSQEGPKVSWHHDIQDVTQPQVQYIIDDELETGKEIVVINGIEGASVDSYVNIQRQDGQVEKKDLGRSFYFPLPRIIVKGKDGS